MRRNHTLNLELALLLGVAAIANGQTTPTVTQTAAQSSCVNIVALSGAKVDCSTLTPAQKKALENIPSILKMALENQEYLDEIMKKLDEIPRGGLVQQNNSGGFNIQQGTTGENSPIINSPITVGNIPKAISPTDKTSLTQYFLQAKSKAKVQIAADQYTGEAPFPDDFYDALKGGGWEMVDAGVRRDVVMFSAGRQFQGAIITVNGDPIPEGQTIQANESDPLLYIGNALKAFKIPVSLIRDKKQPEGIISVQFVGGFPE
jgi:hypothetical protein